MSSLLKISKNNKLGRSLLSIILAAAVLCSTLSMLTLIPAVAKEIWDGTTTTAPVDSDNDGVYEITNAAELAYVIDNDGTMNGIAACSFILTDDIYINDTSKINWQTGEAIGDYTINSWFSYLKVDNIYRAFSGSINGDGYTVYGLYFKGTNARELDGDAAALIPAIAGAVTIENLAVDNAYVDYTNSVSAFIGLATTGASTTISNSYAGEKVTLKGKNAGVFRATAQSNAAGVTLNNCYSLATAITTDTNSDHYKGLVAYIYDDRFAVAFNNCYNANGPLTNCAPSWFCTASNSYATEASVKADGSMPLADGVTVVAADKMQGLDVLTDASKMPNLNTDVAYEATAKYPILKVFKTEIQNPDDEQGGGNEGGEPTPPVDVPDYVWDGTTQTEPVDSDNDGFYEITNGSELAYIIDNDGTINGNTACKFILVNDIYLNAVEHINWQTGEAVAGYTPRQWFSYLKSGSIYHNFEGTINGNGYTIYGLYFKGTNSNIIDADAVALIPAITGTTTIKNLAVDNAYIDYTNGVSAFVGFATEGSYTNISNSYAGQNVTLKGKNAGVFRATAKSSAGALFNNCYSLATTLGANSYGLVAWNWDSQNSVIFANCFNANGPINYNCAPGWFCSASNSYATEESKNADGQKPLTDGVTVITVANMQGEDVLISDAKMPNLNSDKAYIAQINNYPQLIIFTDFAPEVDENPIPDYVWDGKTTAPTQGDGTRKNPYLIATAEELAYAVKNGGQGKYYKLTADIYLNDIDKIDWSNGKPIGAYEPNIWFDNIAFNGTIYGDGHVVYGLYVNALGNTAWGYTGQGLIPRVNPGKSVSISELGIDYAYISGINGASAFIGFAGFRNINDTETASANVLIRESYVGANVTIKGNDAGAFRGGARSDTTVINNCYSFANLIGSSTSGLFGNIWGTSVLVNNSFNANGAITSDFCVANVSAGLKNVYATDAGNYDNKVIVVSIENMKGKDVFTNKSKMPELNVDNEFIATESYPILKAFSDIQGEEFVPEEPGQVWKGTIAKEFAEGEGTQDNPYIISTGSELAYAIKYDGFGGKYFKITHDIYLNNISNKLWYFKDTCNDWFDSGAGFNGHIDGDGHIIYGLWYSEKNENESSGLIPAFKSGTIKNLGVKNAQIIAKQNAAGIVGKTVSGGEKFVTNCFVDETVFVSTSNVESSTGGIVGMADDKTNSEKVSLTIENCYSKASLSSSTERRKNGILGSSWRTPYAIRNCYSVGYPVYTASNGGEATSAYWNYIPLKEDFVNEVRAGKKLSNYILNNYSDVGISNKWTLITIVDRESMGGESARVSMPKLDYVNVYQIVNGGTPKLKIFTSIDGKDIITSRDADFFGKGTGTINDPFIITTVEHLRYLVESIDTKGKYYKLGNDIYVNNTKDANWMNKNPESWYSHVATHSFAGNLDGNGYKIYGLYVNEESPVYKGEGSGWINHGTALFPYADVNATIRNVHIRDSYLSGKGTVGGIVGNILGYGKVGRFKLIACSVDETVTLKGFTVGGLIGASHSGGIDLTYCYASAKMSNTGLKDRVNGLVGDNWGAKVSALEAYTTDYQITCGGLINTIALYSPVEKVGVTLLDKANMLGAKAKKYMDFTWDTVWYTVEGKTPQLKVVPYGAEESLYDEGVEGRVWSGKVSTDFGGGDGTKANPYLIYTPEQMARIFVVQSNEFTYYKLMADLKLNNTSKDNWEDTAKMWYAGKFIFRGVFDGNGHVVSGLYYKDENNTDNSWAGLFQGIGHSSTIKRLGVTQSTVINKGPSVHSYAAAICAYLEHWEPQVELDNLGNKKTVPVISECFGDETVYLEASAAAGILAATQTSVIIENCYFVGELTGSMFAGAIVADNWAAYGYGPTLRNCYGATLDGDPLGDGYDTGSFNDDTVNNQRAFLSNCYIAGASLTSSITPISVMYMKGHQAKEYMPGLDYNKVWKTVTDGTPVLRCFKNAENYTSTRNPKEVLISFGNIGDAVIEPLRGYPGYTPISVEDLPIPERRGYIFNGWRHHKPQGCEFELTVFPNYDITLFANWIEVGFTQNFDGELDEKYDYNEGIEIFKPGLPNYDTKYIHSGWRSLHTLKDSAVDPEFLVSYQNKLLIGYEYEISFWMTTDEDNTTAKLFFEQSKYADVYDEIIGYQEAGTFTGLKAGEWKQYTVKIVANAPYLIVRAEKGTSLFFEDFEAIPTGSKGELGNLIGYNPGAAGNGINGLAPWLIVVIACGAVVILGGATVLTIVLVKKKKA